MNNAEQINYWIDLSEYDLETAIAMLKSKRYLYVGFMCHQTIEKNFKAYYIHIKNSTAPFSHSLSYLAKQAGFYDAFNEDQKNFIDLIEPLNIEARYLTHKERLLKSLNEAKCIEIIDQPRQLQQWIKAKL